MLLDAESGINDSPRAAAYFATTLQILERLGLKDDVADVSYWSSTFSYRMLASGEVVRVDTARMQPPEAPYRYNAHFGQHILGQIVSRHLLQKHDVRVRWNWRVVGLSQDDSSVTLSVETPHGQEHIQADWVVGTDGARSSVRHLLGLAFEGHTWPERFVATNLYYDFDKYGFEPANMIADPVNWAVVARLGRENMWRLTYAENAELDEAGATSRIPQHYAAILPDPSAPYEIVASSPYRVHERCSPKFRLGRVLLAGDAAHACNPCGGMGLTGGVIDSDALVKVLTAVIEGTASESVLDFYSTERRRVFLEVTSPIASRYKQRLHEQDAQRRRADFEEFRQLAETPEQALMATSLSKLLEGNPMPV